MQASWTGSRYPRTQGRLAEEPEDPHLPWARARLLLWRRSSAHNQQKATQPRQPRGTSLRSRPFRTIPKAMFRISRITCRGTAERGTAGVACQPIHRWLTPRRPTGSGGGIRPNGAGRSVLPGSLAPNQYVRAAARAAPGLAGTTGSATTCRQRAGARVQLPVRIQSCLYVTSRIRPLTAASGGTGGQVVSADTAESRTRLPA